MRCMTPILRSNESLILLKTQAAYHWEIPVQAVCQYNHLISHLHKYVFITRQI